MSKNTQSSAGSQICHTLFQLASGFHCYATGGLRLRSQIAGRWDTLGAAVR
jgi:hypothetical protein